MIERFGIIIIAILLVGYVGKSQIPHVMDIKPKLDELKNQEEVLIQTETNLANVTRKANQRCADLEAKKNAKKDIGVNELKTVYKPIYLRSQDTASLFGKEIKDIVQLAKKSRLKMHSMEIFQTVKNEPLLLGKNVSINAILDESAAEAPPATPITPYRGHQLDLGLLGSYKDLKLFLTAVENYDYLVKIKKVETFPYTKNPKILVSNVSLVLFAETNK